MSQPEIQLQVRQQRGDIDGLYELVEGIDQKIGDLDAKFDQKIGALDAKFDRRFDEISGQFAEVLSNAATARLALAVAVLCAIT